MTDQLPSSADVLVVGGGPAGAAAAYWLSRAGHDVTVVERKTYPRAKTCGGALTPRAVQQLLDMELGDFVQSAHRTRGVRLRRGDRAVELPWPPGRSVPDFGLVSDRATLDLALAKAAQRAGARILDGYEALTPLVERGFVRGATFAAHDLISIRSRYVVVADGANSRFGRLLGTYRKRDWPHGSAISTEFTAGRHDDAWLESCLDLVDHTGAPLPGYGWVFPTGTGTVSVGVGLLSTSREFNSVNTTDLLTRFVQSAAPRWGFDPDAQLTGLERGRVPLAGSVGPKAGPTYLVIGDASASASAFNGDGISAALESGRLAAETIGRALTDDNPVALQRYPERVAELYSRHWRLGRRFTRLIGHPATMRRVSSVALARPRIARGALAAMSDELQPGAGGFAEWTYRAAAALARVLPE